MELNLIMPMAGRGSRFFEDGFIIPKPLIEINKKPFFYWSTESIRYFNEASKIVFVVLQEHNEKFDIVSKIKEFYKNADIKILPDVLDGAVLTAMEAISTLDNDDPIIINDCDHMFMSNELNDFIKNIDYSVCGALLTFKSNEPKYSFIRLNSKGFVIETREKEVISDKAICGAYYFRNKHIFMEYSSRYLKNCNYDEFFISGVYNEMIKDDKKIIAFDTNFHIPFGTPTEYYIAEKSDKFEVFDK